MGKEKIKIALVCDYFAPRLGGIESHMRDLSYNLSQEPNLSVHLVTATGASLNNTVTPSRLDRLRDLLQNTFRFSYSQYRQGKLTVHRLNSHLPFKFPHAPYSDQYLQAIFSKADIVHVHVGIITPFAFKAIDNALMMGKPVLVTCHCMLGTLAPVYAKIFPKVQQWYKSGVIFTAVSGKLASQIEQTFNIDVHVLPDGIDEEKWLAENKAQDIQLLQGECIKICASMRLNMRKRPVQLLKIMSEVKSRLPKDKSFKLYLFGDGPLKPILQLLIKYYNLQDEVQLKGRVTGEKLRKYYSDSQIYVFPALLESFGIAALEARTSGLAVVGRENTGSQEFLKHDISAMLAKSDKQMADYVLELICDDEKRNKIIEHNRKNPPKQTWKNLTQLHLQYYKSMTATN